MMILTEIIRKIQSAILNFWDMDLHKTVFVQVRIDRKK
jgi:hypothetical protein